MFDLTNEAAELCVVGRTSFQSGIGSIGFATAELLARNFAVSFLPTEPHMREQDAIQLPNGRRLPVAKDLSRIRASFFCDVLWNGVADSNYALVPPDSLKYAWLVYDSDRLPPRWASLLNTHFDLVLAASPHLVTIAAQNGIETPVACVPIPVDLDVLLAQPFRRRDPRVTRFGCISAFHPRKGMEVLVEAFLSSYAGRPDFELVLHSNLAMGPTLDRVQALVSQAGAANVRISHGSLSDAGKGELISSFDVFVSCSRGEGYSIGPREALACGKVCVLSDVGGHRDLAGVPGVFLVPADARLPARYPELDNLVFGEQASVSPQAVAQALEAAVSFLHANPGDHTAQARRNHAQSYSFARLAGTVGSLVDPSIARYRARPPAPHVSVPARFDAAVEARLGQRADRLPGVRRHVCEAYDAGFFSIFNAFMSHLVWQQRDDRCHAVLPDWDIGRLNERLGGKALSFCYGQPDDGNLWLKLFQPLFGATEAEMQDEAWLWRHAEKPALRHNEVREPLMTYIHAYKLYKDAGFAAWRRQYHRVLNEHIHLRPELSREVEAFVQTHLAPSALVVGAHVRHPSHTVEQPNAVIAHTEAYVEGVRAQLRQRGVDPSALGWTVFLATDQERVVRRFREAFGSRVACYEDVRRTRADEDAAFDALTPEQQNQDGHQLQHLVAADQANWTSRMAWEVVRDAYTMARCHCLLHVVSNVSTAVAYMNPDMDMVFCSA